MSGIRWERGSAFSRHVRCEPSSGVVVVRGYRRAPRTLCGHPGACSGFRWSQRRRTALSMGVTPRVQHDAAGGVEAGRVRRGVEGLAHRKFNSPPYVPERICAYGAELNSDGRSLLPTPPRHESGTPRHHLDTVPPSPRRHRALGIGRVDGVVRLTGGSAVAFERVWRPLGGVNGTNCRRFGDFVA